MSDRFEHLAWLAGIEHGYHDISGTWHGASWETRRRLIRAIGLDPDDVEGAIARLERRPWTEGGGPRCVQPAELGVGRAFAVTCQVYGLRSARNLGIGDLEDVAVLAERAAAAGADCLGLSPLHALFPEDPAHCCPYAPSSRRWLHRLLVAVDRAAADLGLPQPTVPDTTALRESAFVDHVGVAAVKEAALRELWWGFRRAHLRPEQASARGAAFLRFRVRHGTALERFCRFQAIAGAVARMGGPRRPFAEWPAEWRRPESEAVERFAHEHEDEVAFAAFVQWLADEQLAAAQARARRAGMRLGLYLDLAVGVVPYGADAWADPDALVAGTTVGAPPDPLGPLGQNWNIVAPSPLALVESGGEPFRQMIRAAMRHAGALRIDHVLGLNRLFLIPADGTGADGAYLRYPFDLMLRVLAEESRAAGCVVIGEDLGTVPEGFRPRMAEAGLLGYRVVWFERAWPEPRFLAPGEYTQAAFATVSTHDLPTVRGFFAGQDLAWRERLGHLPEGAQRQEEHARRTRDVHLLDARLREEGLLGDDADEASRVLAVHRLLARTRSVLAAVQLEDLVGETEQANLPGTIDEHPNWRRKLRVDLDAALETPTARRILEAVRTERPR